MRTEQYQMAMKLLTGPGVGAEKYDILTAMSVAGLAQGLTFQTSMFRLVALVTARYNWKSNELTVGQREMAALWSVDERTVKREIKRLISANILLLKRPGVRGRVAAYGLNLQEIYRLSAPVWKNVGPDYAARMDERVAKADENVVRVNFQGGHVAPSQDCDSWARILHRLAQEQPTLVDAWFGRLQATVSAEGSLLLRAPSKFMEQYISTHLFGLLALAARTELGPQIQIRLYS
jgi:hypothetical protein